MALTAPVELPPVSQIGSEEFWPWLGLRRGRDAELLDQIDPAALRAMRGVALAADQGLEGMVARLATIFVNRHA